MSKPTGKLAFAYQSIANLEAKLAEMQAKIDALMLEYCPNEMTKEQLSIWKE